MESAFDPSAGPVGLAVRGFCWRIVLVNPWEVAVQACAVTVYSIVLTLLTVPGWFLEDVEEVSC